MAPALTHMATVAAWHPKGMRPPRSVLCLSSAALQCGEEGHLARECPNAPADGGGARGPCFKVLPISWAPNAHRTQRRLAVPADERAGPVSARRSLKHRLLACLPGSHNAGPCCLRACSAARRATSPGTAQTLKHPGRAAAGARTCLQPSCVGRGSTAAATMP